MLSGSSAERTAVKSEGKGAGARALESICARVGSGGSPVSLFFLFWGLQV